MGGGFTYLGLGGGQRYLPRMGEGVPTLDGGRGTYLGWGGGGTYLGQGGKGNYLGWGGGGGTYPGQVMPRAVCLLRLQAGGLFVISNVQP